MRTQNTNCIFSLHIYHHGLTIAFLNTDPTHPLKWLENQPFSCTVGFNGHTLSHLVLCHQWLRMQQYHKTHYSFSVLKKPPVTGMYCRQNLLSRFSLGLADVQGKGWVVYILKISWKVWALYPECLTWAKRWSMNVFWRQPKSSAG